MSAEDWDIGGRRQERDAAALRGFRRALTIPKDLATVSTDYQTVALLTQHADKFAEAMEAWCLEHLGHDLLEIVPAGGYVLRSGEILRREITCMTCQVKQPFTMVLV